MKRLLACWTAACSIWMTARGENLRIVRSSELSPCLPHKDLFENVEDRLYRSQDGTRVFLGPTQDRRYFEVRGFKDYQEREAPTFGKVYPDPQGNFRIWYDRLADGVHFPNGFRWQAEDAVRTRFGVSLDALAFYTVFRDRTEVMETDRPLAPVWSEDGFFLYRLGASEDRMVLVGYQRLLAHQARKHLAIRLLKIRGTFQEMDRLELSDRLVVMDIDVTGEKMLMMNEVGQEGHLFEYDLRSKKSQNLGWIDGFALYLSPEFTLQQESQKWVQPEKSP